MAGMSSGAHATRGQPIDIPHLPDAQPKSLALVFARSLVMGRTPHEWMLRILVAASQIRVLLGGVEYSKGRVQVAANGLGPPTDVRAGSDGWGGQVKSSEPMTTIVRGVVLVVR
jgi:hypothetical protein